MWASLSIISKQEGHFAALKDYDENNFLDAEPIHVSHVNQIMKQQKSNSSPSRVECQWRILEIQEAFDVTASAIPAYQV